MPFQKFGLHPDLVRGVKELGFTRPTPIQADAIPPAMEGRDVLACAMTGSGKTAAFLLPVMHRLIGKKRGTTRALVLTPTRELAAQIEAALNELAVHTPLTAASVFGGMGMGPQEHALRSGVDFVIATPGRLIDHMRRPYARFEGLETLVLDEADRMLDMGFLPDIKRIVKQLPARRQTLFFSATLPEVIQRLAGEWLRNPARINLERKSAPAIGITHALYPVPQGLKGKLLLALLDQDAVRNVLVFTRTKHRANRLAQFLERNGVRAGLLHGNRSQSQRTKALAAFKNGSQRVLVATDIAARGIDVEELSHVINFDVPHVAEDYIHRVGRTGRADATGDAFTFVAPEEEEDLRGIERALGKRVPRIVVPDFDYAARAPAEEKRAPRPSGGGGGRGRPSTRPRSAPSHARSGPPRSRPAGHGGHASSAPPRYGGHAPRSAHAPRTHQAPAARSHAPAAQAQSRRGAADSRPFGYGASGDARAPARKKGPRRR